MEQRPETDRNPRYGQSESLVIRIMQPVFVVALHFLLSRINDPDRRDSKFRILADLSQNGKGTLAGGENFNADQGRSSKYGLPFVRDLDKADVRDAIEFGT